VNLETARSLLASSRLIRLNNVIAPVSAGARKCPLLAQSGHGDRALRCPLSGVERTLALAPDVYSGPIADIGKLLDRGDINPH
jgi:hypothetical protein